MIIRYVASSIAALVLTGGVTSAGANTLAGGLRHTVVVTPDGVVWTWGGNGNGQLGDGSTIDRRTPEAVPLITDAIAVAAGLLRTLVLRADGTLLAWGYNLYGQLGDGSFTQRTDPVSRVGVDRRGGHCGLIDPFGLAASASGMAGLQSSFMRAISTIIETSSIVAQNESQTTTRTGTRIPGF